MRPARLGFLVGKRSFYAPVTLAGIDRSEVEVVGVWVRAEQRSPVRTIRRVARTSGVPYAVSRTVALLRTRPSSGMPEELIPTEIDSANHASFRETLRKSDLDLLVTLFYPEILRDATYVIPRHGTLNVHPGRLPEYGGMNPVFWALAEGSHQLGVTAHLITDTVDGGPIIRERLIEVERPSLHEVYTFLAMEAAAMLNEIAAEIRSTNALQSGPPRVPVCWHAHPTAEAYRQFRKLGGTLS